MVHRIVPFLFFALAIQQAASLCICRADESLSDAVVTENCSQWSAAQHEERILDVLNADEKPCASHELVAPAKRSSKSGHEELTALHTHPVGLAIDQTPLILNVSIAPVPPESSAPAVSLPLLN